MAPSDLNPDFGTHPADPQRDYGEPRPLTTRDSDNGRDPHEECAQCGNPAVHSCAGCKGAPDSTQTLYCKKECQEAHWSIHKASCKELGIRRRFYRAAGLLQDAWYVYAESIFDVPVKKVKFEGNDIHVFLKRRPDEDFMLRPFPSDMVKSEQDKQAILNSGKCVTASASMHNTIKALFSGTIYSIFEEDVFPLKNESRQVRLIKAGGFYEPEEIHSILRVILKTREQYTIDLSGAQYGWYESTMPQHEYSERRVGCMRQCKYFGNSRLELDNIAISYFSGQRNGELGATFALIYDMSQLWDKEMEEWRKGQSGHTWLDILEFPEPEFGKKCQSFLSHMSEFMGTVRNKIPYRLGRTRQKTNDIQDAILKERADKERMRETETTLEIDQ